MATSVAQLRGGRTVPRRRRTAPPDRAHPTLLEIDERRKDRLVGSVRFFRKNVQVAAFDLKESAGSARWFSVLFQNPKHAPIAPARGRESPNDLRRAPEPALLRISRTAQRDEHPGARQPPVLEMPAAWVSAIISACAVGRAQLALVAPPHDLLTVNDHRSRDSSASAFFAPGGFLHPEFVVPLEETQCALQDSNLQPTGS